MITNGNEREVSQVSILAPKDSGMEILGERIEQVAQIAHESGLRPSPTQFIVTPAHTIYEFASSAMPGGFSHWTKGRDYYHVKTMYDYGLSKIYELVVNTNPAMAFLLENNPLIANTTVAAHVLAHVDFFANNPAFARTNRQMAETVLQNAQRIEQYRFKYGEDEIEDFLDAALSIKMNFDYYNYDRPDANQYILMSRQAFEDAQKKSQRRPSEYDDLLDLGEKKEDKPKGKAPFPYAEEPDLLYFIGNFSPLPLEDWQKDCLSIIRSEYQYFLPQMKTKIMNEGWATLWHARIMRKMGDLGYITEGESTDFDIMHSGVVSENRRQINPYLVGWKIWEDIDRRFRGIPRQGDKKVSTWYGDQAEEASLPDDIFAVRSFTDSDHAFVANYLTPNLIDDLELYTYRLEGDKWLIAERNPEKVKQQLLETGDIRLAFPTITVAQGGGDYNGNRELYLHHSRDQYDLESDWAQKTLQYIYKLWGRPVHLETRNDKEKIVLSCQDGKEATSITTTL